MKNRLLSVLLFLSICFFVRSGERVTLIEHFTSASCAYCEPTNRYMNPVYDNLAKQSKLVVIKYQGNYGYDPMYEKNPVEISTRVNYYTGSMGYPTIYCDGKRLFGAVQSQNTINELQDSIENAITIPSNWELDVNYDFDTYYKKLNISVKVKSLVEQTGNFKLYVALLEKDVTYEVAPGTNGESVFNHVMRKMLPDASGTILKTSWTAGEEIVISQENISIPAYYQDFKNLEIVAFIQSNDKSVKQAAYAAPKTDIPGPNCDVALSKMEFSRSGSVTYPVVSLDNNSNETITSLMFTLTYPDKTEKTITYTQPISPGKSSIALSDLHIDLIRDIHTYTLTSFFPNQKPDTKLSNNTVSMEFLKLYPAIAAPVFEDFEINSQAAFFANSIFYDPAFISDPAKRSGIYAGGAEGSAYALVFKNYWNSKSGDVDEYYFPNFNLTNLPDPAFYFRYAYCPGSKNDTLSVQISKDDGIMWTDLFKKGGKELNTTTSTSKSSEYLNPSGSDWKKVYFSLSEYAGEQNVGIRFKMRNSYGNNLYLDQISVQTNDGSGVKKIASDVIPGFKVYPAITSGKTTVSFDSELQAEVYIIICGVDGNKVYSKSFGNLGVGSHSETIDISSLGKGLYMLTLGTGGKIATQKIIVQ